MTNDNKTFACILMVLLLCVVPSLAGASANNKATNCQEAMLQGVSIIELQSEEDKNEALRGIRGGEVVWIKRFPYIRSNSDAGWSTLLDGTIGYSLKKQPRLTLEAIQCVDDTVWPSKEISYAELVCGDTDEMWNENDKVNKIELASRAINEIDGRLNSLSLVQENTLLSTRDQCVRSLLKNKSFWDQFPDK